MVQKKLKDYLTGLIIDMQSEGAFLKHHNLEVDEELKTFFEENFVPQSFNLAQGMAG